MSVQRFIDSSFWDDEWVQGLNPIEKFLYLYLLTNPLTNIAGVYKITMRRICFDTGMKGADVEEILERFRSKNKACKYEEYMVIPSWPKHQRWEDRGKIKTGIEIILSKLPESLLKYMISIRYSYPISKVSIPHIYLPSYFDLDSDTDSDTDSNSPSGDTLSSCQEQRDNKLADFIASEGREAKIAPIKAIIDYFNDRCKTKYTEKADYIRRLIKARWNDGYRVPDFQTVIDIKAKQWLSDPKMLKYLRPATLFSPSKFDSYLQEARKAWPNVETNPIKKVEKGSEQERSESEKESPEVERENAIKTARTKLKMHMDLTPEQEKILKEADASGPNGEDAPGDSFPESATEPPEPKLEDIF